MADLRLKWDNTKGRADLVLLPDGTLDTSLDLETMVIVSLFTDRLADPADRLPAGSSDRRGWWGDSYASPSGELIGSRLWLLTTATDQTPLIAKSYILESLAWLIEDGIASAVEAECWYPPGTRARLDARITVSRGTGDPLRLDYAAIWQAELTQ